MEKWDSQTYEKLYEMCNKDTYIGQIQHKDHPLYIGYNHYLLNNDLHVYIKSGGGLFITKEDITDKYENQGKDLDPSDPYFGEKFPLSDVYLNRFRVPESKINGKGCGVQIIIGSGCISFSNDGKVSYSSLEKPTIRPGYDTEISTKNSTVSIESIINRMLEKYNFSFKGNLDKKSLYEKALEICSDIRSLVHVSTITPKDALKHALADGTTREDERNALTAGTTREEYEDITRK